MSAKITGGCLCGAIRYEIDHDIGDVIVCHCSDCRRASGSGASHNVPVPTDAITFTKGKPKTFEKTVDSGRKLKRHFCPECGSNLFTERDSTPHMRIVKVGALDDASGLKIGMHIWTSSALPWMERDESVPNHPKNRPA